jgi:hypothetical protein
MINNIVRKSTIAVIFSLTMAHPAYAAVPNTFSAGSSANAADVNANFTDLDSRVSALESASGGFSNMVEVDCAVDPDAFIDMSIADNTTYTLSGMCHGPIGIWKKRNVVIQGDDIGTKDDGIILPPGLIAHPYEALGIWESSAEVRNLTIDAQNYVSALYSFGSHVSALGVGQLSVARAYDVDFVGGDTGINVYQSSYLKTYDNVNVTGFNQSGIGVQSNSHARLSEEIQVTTTQVAVDDNYSNALYAGLGGSIRITNGGTFTAPTSNEEYSIDVFDNGTLRIDHSGTSNLNGNIGAASGGVVRIKGGAIVTGSIWTWQSGNIRLENSSQSGGDVSAWENSIVRIKNSTIETIGGFETRAERLSTLRLENTGVTSDSPLNVYRFSILDLRGTTDLGNAGISCNDPANETSIDEQSVTNVGDVCAAE